MANHSITVYGNNAGALFDGIVLYDTVEFNVIESIKSTYSGIFTVEFSGFVLVEKKDISVVDGESRFTIVLDTYALRRAFAIVPENGKRTLVCRLLNPQSGRIGAEFFVKIQNYTKRVEDFSPADKEKLDNLKDIAFTGDYGDLLNTPEIPQDYIRSVNGKTDSDIVLTHNDVGAEVAGSVSDHNGSVSAHEILFSEVELNLKNHNESSDSHNELFAQKTNVDTTAAIEARVAELEEKAEGDTHGTVTSVNDIEPDGDGNVSIAASDILTDTGNTIEENLNTRATTLETDEIKERVSALEEKEIPTDISDLTDTNNKVQTTAESKVSEHNNNNNAHSTLFLNKANAIHSHVVSDISDFPEIPDVPDIPTDISELTDNTNVIGTKAEEVADNKVSEHNTSETAHSTLFDGKADAVHTHVVTDITDFPEIPTDISDLTDTTSIVANTADNKVSGHNEASDAHSGLFAGKANVVHTHVVADVTDFPTIPSTSDIEGIASDAVEEHNSSTDAHSVLFSEKADVSELANYLPLSGGTMTGTIIVSTTLALCGSDATESLLICGATGRMDGASIELTSEGTVDRGAFMVRATHSEDGSFVLSGKTDGTLTWDGKNIVRTVNNVSANAAGDVTITSVSGNAGTATKLQTARTITLAGDLSGSTTFDGSGNVSITATVKDDSHNHVISNVDGLQSALDGKAASSHTHSYLPLSGGKMTSVAAMSRSVNNSYLSIFGGTGTGYGAQIDLCGVNHSTMPSTFQIHARNSSTDKVLVGKTDGTLTWGGKGITLGYPKYSAGVALGSVSTYTATGDGWLFAYVRRNDAYWNLRVGGVKIFVAGGSGYDAGSCLIPVKKGDVIKTYNGHDETTTAYAVTMIFYTNR